MSWFTVILGDIAEGAYTSIGDVDTSSASKAAPTLLKKLALLKTISQDLGSAAAVAFVAQHDDQLGPFAQQIVDAVNGKAIAEAVSIVVGLLGIIGN
ncbi:MAG: hypothetical protein P4L33_03325 [Capsulimonadaceae bacterium]|nr:hypothetical protein [Capsulimonadaceae bacterium]